MKVYGQLQFAQLHVRASDPTPATQALIWYNSTNNVVRLDNGSGILELVDTSTVQTLSSKVLTTPTLTSYMQVPHIATPGNPSAGNMFLYAKNDDSLYLKTSAGVEKVIEAGQVVPTRNYFYNGFTEIYRNDTTITGDGVSTLVNWRQRRTGSATVQTIQTTSNISGKIYAVEVNASVGGATSTLQIGTQIERRDMEGLRGKTVTIKIKARSKNVNITTVDLYTFYTTNDVSIPFGSGATAGPTQTGNTLNTTNTDISFTFTMPANASTFFFQMNNPFQTLSVGDGFIIENFMMYEGSHDQDYTRRTSSYSSEELMLQRYYRLIRGASGTGTGTVVDVAIQNPIPMRATPTVSQTGTIAFTSAAADYFQSSAGISSITSDAYGGRYRLANFTGIPSPTPMVQSSSNYIELDAQH